MTSRYFAVPGQASPKTEEETGRLQRDLPSQRSFTIRRDLKEEIKIFNLEQVEN